jgi:hypothetical protein
LPLHGIKPRFLSHPACSLLAILTEPSLLQTAVYLILIPLQLEEITTIKCERKTTRGWERGTKHQHDSLKNQLKKIKVIAYFAPFIWKD